MFGASDAFIDATQETTFRPMAEFLAGVGIAAGRTYVDVGYRFNKVFENFRTVFVLPVQGRYRNVVLDPVGQVSTTGLLPAV